MTCLEHRTSITLQSARAYDSLHTAGFTHNDIKANNICVQKTPAGPVVTLIDFGMTEISREKMALACSWSEGLHYAPELCMSDKVGRCSSLSDVYSVGRVLCQLFEAHETPAAVGSWFEASRSMKPVRRQGLRVLIGYLESEEQKRLAGERVTQAEKKYETERREGKKTK